MKKLDTSGIASPARDTDDPKYFLPRGGTRRRHALLTIIGALGFLSACAAEVDNCQSPPESVVEITSAASNRVASSGPSDRVGVHRSSNPSTGEHFYTTDTVLASANSLEPEALDYFYLWVQAADGLSPFFQCRKPNGKRFYTTSTSCENAGAVLEAQLGFIAGTRGTGLTPLHRLYHPGKGDHLYTIRAGEKSEAKLDGYVEEGISGYVWVPPFYITPVSETSDPSVLVDLRNTFSAPGLGDNIVLGWARSTWYMSEVRDARENYAYDPSSSLRRVFEIAVEQNLPLVINMNGGRWSNQSPLVDHLRTRTERGHPVVTLDQNGAALFSYDFGQQYFSLSRLNRPYYEYKKRNLQAAAAEVAGFRRLHPDLFVGVSLDSETLLSDNPSRYGDYNPLAIEEWRQWLTGTGIYDPVTGEYAGQARSPVFASIAAFNTAMQTTFSAWSELTPPRTPTENRYLWHEWRIWGIMMVAHHTQDMANWIESQGIPRESIFNHQTPGMNPLLFGDDLSTSILFNGATAGITAYGCTANNTKLIRYLRARARHVGIFEWNPRSDVQSQYRALETAYRNTVRVVAPYHWPVDHYFPQYSIKGSATEAALRDFIRTYAVAEQ